MFKRVEKRRKKREEEEELGLDEDMKDVLGIQDTDSDESDSESDSDEASNDGSDQRDSARSDNGERGEDVVTEKGQKRKRDSEDDEDEESNSEEDAGGDPKQPIITVQEALKDPLYTTSLWSGAKGCIVCPGKVLKNIQTVNLHMASNAHSRRFKLFTELTADSHPDENAWDILQNEVFFNTVKASPKPTEKISKREEKRRIKKAAMIAKREKTKAKKAKAKKAKAPKVAKAEGPSADSSAPSPAKPAKKKEKDGTPRDERCVSHER